MFGLCPRHCFLPLRDACYGSPSFTHRAFTLFHEPHGKLGARAQKRRFACAVVIKITSQNLFCADKTSFRDSGKPCGHAVFPLAALFSPLQRFFRGTPLFRCAANSFFRPRRFRDVSGKSKKRRFACAVVIENSPTKIVLSCHTYFRDSRAHLAKELLRTAASFAAARSDRSVKPRKKVLVPRGYKDLSVNSNSLTYYLGGLLTQLNQRCLLSAVL